MKYMTTTSINQNEQPVGMAIINEDDTDGQSDLDMRDRENYQMFYSQPFNFQEKNKPRRRKHKIIEKFYQSRALDSYIAENLYGGVGDYSSMDGATEFNRGLKYFSYDKTAANVTPTSFRNSVAVQEEMSSLLSPFEVYITLVKGYCVILILILPRAFTTGGYITAAVLMFASGMIGTFCAHLLVQSGLKAQLNSYSELTGFVLGSKAKVIIDLCISTAQFSFTVSHIAFIIESLQTTVNVQTGLQTSVWPYALLSVVSLTLIAWVEDIKKFSVTFLVGSFLIFLTVIIDSIYCFWLLHDQGGPGPNITAYNAEGFWATVGFAIYSYEGIGIVMPVLAKAREPEKFSKSLIAAMATLCVVFIFFGELTAIAFGETLTEPYVTEMLPANNWIVTLVKLAVTVNLVCSYPITIKPTNEIIESYMFPRRDRNQSPQTNTHSHHTRLTAIQSLSKCQYLGTRVTRALVCISAAALGIALKDDMAKFLGFFGALLGSPMAMTFPALIHYKSVALSRWEKLIDILIILLSLFTLVLSTTLSLQSWILKI